MDTIFIFFFVLLFLCGFYDTYNEKIKKKRKSEDSH